MRKKSDLAVMLFQVVNRAIADGQMNEYITPELFFKLLTVINATIIEHIIASTPDKTLDEAGIEMLCDVGVEIVLHGIGKHNKGKEKLSD